MADEDTLDMTDLPGLFQVADAASTRGQRTYFRSLRLRLSLAILAAVASAVTIAVNHGRVNLSAVVAVLAFVGVLVTDVFDMQSRPGVDWYQGRALAESVKTLSWRYAVGGTPFPIDMAPKDAEMSFLGRLTELVRDLPAVVGVPTSAPAISPAMRRARQVDLAGRRRAYLRGRIVDQQSWYAGRATHHRRRADRLQVSGLILEILGVAAGLGEVVRVLDIDLAGIIAALIAANATAYALASQELGIIRSRLELPVTESEWGPLVADAEDAISREHTTWRASHRT
jgi:hypothetical protein